MKHEEQQDRRSNAAQVGLAAWLVKFVSARLRDRESRLPRLALVERIGLAPRQSLALVEADGRRFLVATSQDGGPAFYALDHLQRRALTRSSRVSW